MNKLRVILFVCIHVLLIIPIRAQGLFTPFAEGTDQYTTFDWKFISSDNFDAYFYGDAQYLAEDALLVAENQLKILEEIIDYRMGGKSQILIYHNPNDLRQTNLFTQSSPFNPGGYSYALNNKVIVGFTGNKEDLKKQIRYGISELLVSELMYGGSFQEKLQTSTLLYLPEWYYKGLLSFLSEGWSPELDSEMKDAMLRKRFSRFNLINKEEAVLAGHSWWYFISQSFGKRSISDLLYLTRVSKGYENALIFVLGANTRTVFNDWISFYEIRFGQDGGNEPYRNALKLPKKFNSKKLLQAKISPNGKQAALSFSENGKFELWLFDLQTSKKERIYSKGYIQKVKLKEVDMTITWDGSGKHLHLFTNEKGKLYDVYFDKEGKTLSRIQVPVLEGISWANHHPSENTILLSAFKDGFSDLYIWKPKSEELEVLFSDPFDDLYPSFNASGSAIYFSSDRQNNLPGVMKDSLFFYNDSAALDVYMIPYPFSEGKLKRITHTPFLKEIQARDYGNEAVAYLSDNNGIYNTYVTQTSTDFEKGIILLLDSANTAFDTLYIDHGINTDAFELSKYTDDSTLLKRTLKAIPQNHFKDVIRHYPLSYFSRNISHFDVGSDIELSVLKFNGYYYLNTIETSTKFSEDAKNILVTPTGYRKSTGYQAFVSDSSVNSFLVQKSTKPEEVMVMDTMDKDTTPKADYYFQSGFPPVAQTIKVKKKNNKPVAFDTRSRPYQTGIFPDYFAAQLLDNSIINTYYQNNNALAGSFNSFSRIYARIEIGGADLFRDHTIKLGGRIPFLLFGSDFYLEYQNRKHKLDFGASVYRQSRLAGTNAPLHRVFIQELRTSFSYPLGKGFSLVSSPFFRQDKTLTISTDQSSLTTPDQTLEWLGTTLEIHLQRSEMEELNLPKGFQGKVYLNFFQNITNQNYSTYILGLDFRNYTKVHHKIIWANRLSAGASFGPSNVLYRIGGIENWIGPRSNHELGSNDNYFYTLQSVATGVRAFSQNIRNGGNYLIFNSEIRVPIFSYLMRVPVSIDFVRNMQLVGFYDIGSAWNGFSPFSEQHYNTSYIDQGSVSIKRIQKNNPFVSGFGAGLRTRIFGYFLRADVTWGLENGALINEGKPLLMTGVGFDF